MFAVLHPDAVIVTNDELDKEKAITTIVNLACSVYTIDECSEILENVINRESKLSTGIGLEVAVPHCWSTQVKHCMMAVMLVPRGVEYNSVDNKPVKLIFLIISPVKDITGHLASLSAISHAVSDETIRTRLLEATSVEELYRSITELHE
jgi:mannitol/fructose-specific phosphotransferase system IIA component (Ntr-type)